MDALTTCLSLTEREVQAAFRALIEYRRILKFSEIRDSELVRPEIDAVDSLSEKISLSFHYPDEVPPKRSGGAEGERNVLEA